MSQYPNLIGASSKKISARPDFSEISGVGSDNEDAFRAKCWICATVSVHEDAKYSESSFQVERRLERKREC